MIAPRKTAKNLRGGDREAETSAWKILAFAAAVFVLSTASVVALLLHLGQGAFASLLAGFFVGATAAVEVGWFGGSAYFGVSGFFGGRAETANPPQETPESPKHTHRVSEPYLPASRRGSSPGGPFEERGP